MRQRPQEEFYSFTWVLDGYSPDKTQLTDLEGFCCFIKNRIQNILFVPGP